MTITAPGLGLTERLADSVLNIDVPQFLNEGTVRDALVDTLAVSAAASNAGGVRTLRSVTIPEPFDPEALWVGSAAGGPPMAAFLNGTAAHFLDFDDVSPTMPLHPSAVLVPALLAAAGGGRLPFDRYVEAFNVGQAMFRTIAQALPSPVHYGRGWHSTATVGRLAAVAALARLEQLDVQTTRVALAMASTLASGSRANFGTMTKPMHAGLAAQDALLAIRWARAGITASVQELEAPTGYFARFGDTSGTSLVAFAEDIEDRFEFWLNDWAFDWGLKRFPSCYGTHRAIDAALDLRLDIDGQGQTSGIEGIERIDVLVHENGTAPLILDVPESATEAKFNLEYCVALALLNGTVELEDFTPERFASRDDVRELARKVTLREQGSEREYATVSVSTAHGPRLEAKVLAAKGDSSNPLDAADLKAKVLACFAYAGKGEARAAKLSAAVDGLAANADVMELVTGWTGGTQ